jgi:hypothetical protein
VHEADIQRNTVQFKVAIQDPVAALKPEMLVRVRIIAGDSPGERGNATGASTGYEELILLLPLDALLDRNGEEAAAWFVMHDARRGTFAARRRVTLGPVDDDEFVEIVSGASPTDRVIARPPASLVEGARVRVLGESVAPEGDER